MKKIFFYSILYCFLLSACGAGSDSSGSSNGSNERSTITYTGLTSQANIDSSNAKTLVRDSYGGPMGPGGGFSSKPGEDSKSLYFSLYEALLEITQNINQNIALNKPHRKIITDTESVTKDGSCGGSMSSTITTTSG